MSNSYTDGTTEIVFEKSNKPNKLSPLSRLIIGFWYDLDDIDNLPEQNSFWAQLEDSAYLHFDTFNELLGVFMMSRFDDDEQAQEIIDNLKTHVDCLEYMKCNHRFKDISHKMINNILDINDDLEYTEWFNVIINDPDSNVHCIEFNSVDYGDGHNGVAGYVSKNINGEEGTYMVANKFNHYSDWIDDNDLDSIANKMIYVLETELSCIKDVEIRKEVELLIKEKLNK
jgi:hypothetical protein